MNLRRRHGLGSLAALLALIGWLLVAPGCGGKGEDAAPAADQSGDAEAPPPAGPAGDTDTGTSLLPPGGQVPGGASPGGPMPMTPPGAAAEAEPEFEPSLARGPVHPVRNNPFDPLDDPLEPTEEEETDASAVSLGIIRANITLPPDRDEGGDSAEVDTINVVTSGVVWGAVNKAILSFPDARGDQPQSQVVRLGDRVRTNVGGRGERELVVYRIEPKGVTLRDPQTGRLYLARRGDG